METNNNHPTFDIPVIRVHQNNFDMYVGAIAANKLFEISKVDRIRLEILEVPKYAGYQRALVDKRVDSIREYLKTPSSTFPNAIIASLDSDAIENWDIIRNSEVSLLKIYEKEDAIKIIDGQHRAAALDTAPSDFQVIVTFIIDLDIIQSAEIFAKINSTQKAVNPSIAFQLFGYSNHRSPQKTAHDIADTLNITQGSPFYKKLRMLGTKDAWSIGTLSQSTFAKNLMKLFTKDYSQDEYLLLRGKSIEEYSGYPLRDLFRNDKDDEILKIVWKYFFNIASIWQDQWNDETGTSILLKTTGFNAFIELLKKWLLSDKAYEILEDTIRTKLEGIKDKYNTPEYKFIKENYPAGHQGVIKLRNQLLDDLRLG